MLCQKYTGGFMTPRNILRRILFFGNHSLFLGFLHHDIPLTAKLVCHCFKFGWQIHGKGAVFGPPNPTAVITNQ